MTRWPAAVRLGRSDVLQHPAHREPAASGELRVARNCRCPHHASGLRRRLRGHRNFRRPLGYRSIAANRKRHMAHDCRKARAVPIVGPKPVLNDASSPVFTLSHNDAFVHPIAVARRVANVRTRHANELVVDVRERRAAMARPAPLQRNRQPDFAYQKALATACFHNECPGIPRRGGTARTFRRFRSMTCRAASRTLFHSPARKHHENTTA